MSGSIEKFESHYWEHQGHSGFICVLKLLGYTCYSNGIEMGYKKGNNEFWFYDDGTVTLYTKSD